MACRWPPRRPLSPCTQKGRTRPREQHQKRRCSQTVARILTSASPCFPSSNSWNPAPRHVRTRKPSIPRRSVVSRCQLHRRRCFRPQPHDASFLSPMTAAYTTTLPSNSNPVTTTRSVCCASVCEHHRAARSEECSSCTCRCQPHDGGRPFDSGESAPPRLSAGRPLTRPYRRIRMRAMHLWKHSATIQSRRARNMTLLPPSLPLLLKTLPTRKRCAS